MLLSFAEENYLKTIYHLSQRDGTVSVSEISEYLDTKPASVSDMMKKLATKQVIEYAKYKGVCLTEEGRTLALWIVRKHRLWEVFLVEKLKFHWDEVHEVAEQLEHIQSALMIERLDEFLGYPQYDPHGDPIPDRFGKMNHAPQQPLSLVNVNILYQVNAVKDTSSSFLQYLDKIGIAIGSKIKVLDRIAYDQSVEIELNEKHLFISEKVAENILVIA